MIDKRSGKTRMCTAPATRLFFPPAYSPHLNPIEILWRMMKYRWLTKVDYLSWSRLKKAIFAIIKAFGQDYCIDFTNLQTKNPVSFNSA